MPSINHAPWLPNLLASLPCSIVKLSWFEHERALPIRQKNNGARGAQVAVHLRDFVPVVFVALQDVQGQLWALWVDRRSKSRQILASRPPCCDLHGSSKVFFNSTRFVLVSFLKRECSSNHAQWVPNLPAKAFPTCKHLRAPGEVKLQNLHGVWKDSLPWTLTSSGLLISPSPTPIHRIGLQPVWSSPVLCDLGAESCSQLD